MIVGSQHTRCVTELRTGDSKTTRSVLIDGKKYDVGENCWFALWQARIAQHPTLVWLDAICIDQNSVHEKGYQVQGIADVFRKANRVLVSLGEEANDNAYLFERLYKLYTASSSEGSHRLPDQSANKSAVVAQSGNQRELSKYNEPGAIREPPSSLVSWLKGSTPGDFARLMDAFMTLGSHPYWTRLWVHPELVLASEAYFCYGSSVCRIDIVVKFLPLLNEIIWNPKLRKQIPLALRKRFESEWQIRDLPMRMMLNRVDMARHTTEYFGGCRFRELCDLQCKEPRDRVFALVPLIDWQKLGLQPIAVDYDRTGLSLAFECVKFCKDFDDAEYLLRSLRVECQHNDPVVDSYLRHRRLNSPQMRDIDGSLALKSSCRCGSSQSRSALKVRFHYFCLIESYLEGLVAEASWSTQGSDEALPISEFLAALLGPHRVVRQASNGRNTGNVLALVPENTMPGDYIMLPFTSYSRNAHCALVSRRDRRGIYHFLGHAIVAATMRMPFSRTGFELRMDEHDAITHALCAIKLSQGCTRCTHHYFGGLHPSLQRLRVPFTTATFSSYAVKLSKTKCTRIGDICHNCGEFIDEQPVSASREHSAPASVNTDLDETSDEDEARRHVETNDKMSTKKSRWRRLWRRSNDQNR
jgi:hypothetical protein